LCTIQRSKLDHLIGLIYRFHNFEQFYYIESLTDESKSTLALCAGVKLFDRIIECNGVNIEGDSEVELLKRINQLDVLTIQLLVCSPATYSYYKSKNKNIHNNLETVKHMRPMNDNRAGELLQDKNLKTYFCFIPILKPLRRFASNKFVMVITVPYGGKIRVV
jgi:hypothetical protein